LRGDNGGLGGEAHLSFKGMVRKGKKWECAGGEERKIPREKKTATGKEKTTVLEKKDFKRKKGEKKKREYQTVGLNQKKVSGR